MAPGISREVVVLVLVVVLVVVLVMVVVLVAMLVELGLVWFGSVRFGLDGVGLASLALVGF